jgi:hypothetical protein
MGGTKEDFMSLCTATDQSLKCCLICIKLPKLCKFANTGQIGPGVGDIKEDFMYSQGLKSQILPNLDKIANNLADIRQPKS